MLHAAHAIRPDIGRPTEVPDDWQEDEAYRSCTCENPNGSPCGYIMAPELWLPGDFLFFFQCMELRGQEVVVVVLDLAEAAVAHGLPLKLDYSEPGRTARNIADEALVTGVIHNMLWIQGEERWISGTGVTTP